MTCLPRRRCGSDAPICGNDESAVAAKGFLFPPAGKLQELT